MRAADAVQAAGTTMFGGGAYKRRTSPYSFPGRGCRPRPSGRTGLPIVTGLTLDVVAVPVLKQMTHLPVIVDPGLAAGRRDLAPAAAGADGIIVEVHRDPDEAICDGPQQLRAEDFPAVFEPVERAAALAGRQPGAGAV